MKRFMFTLQSLYDIALSIEEQLKLKMQKIRERLNATLSELEQTRKDLAYTQQSLAKDMRLGVGSDKLLSYSQYCEKLTDCLDILEEKRKKIELEKQKCRKEQIENKKELKTYEKLRAKQYEEYLFEAAREEEKNIGDFVSYQTSIK
ncbi:MAG TPA: flagellar FliJ family protein [Clostridia bacterium]|nr:MAG: flagellar biosynthesis chaperone [Firmicutes bacterium ADurb.Bin356]HOF94868.1 flagellar FliJ family protein [Clostridia bacterium]HOR12860.1 flagellar FliJ family protein [Clostridia bacterium]